MNKIFEIEIEEVLQKVVKVKADSLDKAIDKVEEGYRNEKYVLDYNNFKGIEFRKFKNE